MAILQTAWQTFINRVSGDTEVQKYFAQLDLTDRTGNRTGNWLEIKPGLLEGVPKAVPTLKTVIFPIDFSVISITGDLNNSEKQALKGLEIFINSIEKVQTDATWQASFVNIDWAINEKLRLDKNQIQMNGVITLRTQPYTMGAL